MLVSHRHKFIYTKTVKTGGTSVEAYFERFCMPDNQWSLSHGRDEHVSEAGIIGFRGPDMPKSCVWWNHMPAAQIKAQLGARTWSAYRKFCVIRNPYDKVISAFYFFRLAQQGAASFEDVDRERAEFEQWLLHQPQLPIDRDKYLIDGKFCLDDVLRYETLSTDLARLCTRLALPWDPASLPTFKAGIRPKKAKAEALYTDASRKIVERAFAFELDYFGYSFPSPERSGDRQETSKDVA